MSNGFDMALFEPEVVLPAQMSWGARRWRHLWARALMLAILEDAILCIERGRRRRHHHTRQLAAEAESWVCSDSREWLFSFASICDVLGIDADALRGRLGWRRAPGERRSGNPCVGRSPVDPQSGRPAAAATPMPTSIHCCSRPSAHRSSSGRGIRFGGAGRGGSGVR